MNEPTRSLNLSPEQFIADRVEQYQGWYDKKASATKALYLRMRAFSVVGGALVPVLVNVPSQRAVFGVRVIQAFVTVVSLLVVILVSLETVFHYREQWKNYRSTEQLLGHEKFLFRSRVGRYHGLTEDDAFRMFVERIEDAITSENAATLNVMTMASEPSEKAKSTRSEQA